MSLNFTIYSAFFLATTLISFLVVFLCLQRLNAKGAKELAQMMTFAGLWSLCIIFETAATTVNLKMLFSKIEYIHSVCVPVLYLIFVLHFTGNAKILTRRNTALLFIIPLITLGLALTNEKHLLIWSGNSPIKTTSNLMEYYHGTWFWIGYMGYAYLILLISTIILFVFIARYSRAFRFQAILVLIAALCPWIASIVYLFFENPWPGLNLPSISLLFTGTFFLVAIFFTQFLELVPVARETVLEIIPSGILVIDLQNRIQDINKPAISFLGIVNKDIIGKTVSSVAVSNKKLLDAMLTPEQNNPGDQQIEHEGRIFSIATIILKNQSKSRLIVIDDITSQKLAEMQIREQNQELQKLNAGKDQLMSILAHDLKNHFHSILGYVSILKGNLRETSIDTIESQFTTIQTSAQSAFNLLEELLMWSMSQSGKISFKPQLLKTEDLFNDFLPELKTIANTRNCSVNLLPTSVTTVYADVIMLRTILRNLVSNAIKFTGSYGTIMIELKASTTDYIFSVIDNGIGIPGDVASKLFKVSQVKTTRGAAGENGTGLGLLICKEFVEKHRGNIWVESEIEHGSSFSFSIPMHAN